MNKEKYHHLNNNKHPLSNKENNKPLSQTHIISDITSI